MRNVSTLSDQLYKNLLGYSWVKTPKGYYLLLKYFTVFKTQYILVK